MCVFHIKVLHYFEVIWEEIDVLLLESECKEGGGALSQLDSMVLCLNSCRQWEATGSSPFWRFHIVISCSGRSDGHSTGEWIVCDWSVPMLDHVLSPKACNSLFLVASFHAVYIVCLLYCFFTFMQISRKLFIPFLSVRAFHIEYFEPHIYNPSKSFIMTPAIFID